MYKHFLDKCKNCKRTKNGIEKLDGSKGKFKFIVKTDYVDTNFRFGCNPILRVQFMSTESQKQENGIGVITSK